MSARYDEGRKWLEAALAAEKEAPLLVRAKANLVAGFLAAGQGMLLHSQPHLEEALALYRRAGSAEGVAMTVATLGILAAYSGDRVRAGKLYKESFDRYRKLGDPWGFSGSLRALAADIYVRVLRGLSGVSEGEDNHKRAVALREEALALCREWGDNAGVALYLLQETGYDVIRDNPKRAIKYLEESLILAREVYAGIVPDVLFVLGNAFLVQGENKRALALHKEALVIYRETAQPDAPWTLAGIASSAAALEDDIRAARLWGAAQTALQSIGASLHPDDLALYGPDLDAARSRLGEVAWEEALTEGRKMTLDEAVSYALEEEEAGG